MCNLLIALFRGKFTEAVDLGEKEKLEIPGGCVQTPSGKEPSVRGGGGGVRIFSGTAHWKKGALCLEYSQWPQTEDTVLPNTDQPRPVNNIFIFSTTKQGPCHVTNLPGFAEKIKKIPSAARTNQIA